VLHNIMYAFCVQATLEKNRFWLGNIRVRNPFAGMDIWSTAAVGRLNRLRLAAILPYSDICEGGREREREREREKEE
jgi:hypothetical protein